LRKTDGATGKGLIKKRSGREAGKKLGTGLNVNRSAYLKGQQSEEKFIKPSQKDGKPKN